MSLRTMPFLTLPMSASCYLEDAASGQAALVLALFARFAWTASAMMNCSYCPLCEIFTEQKPTQRLFSSRRKDSDPLS